MKPTAQDIITRPEFQALTSARRTVSAILTVAMLGAYFGFILVLAFDKTLLAGVVAEGLTLGIPVGLGIILLAWALTGIYVGWANTSYDTTVAEIRQTLKRSE
jgi:uncharacterized membrane protein (DUF485 family)